MLTNAENDRYRDSEGTIAVALHNRVKTTIQRLLDELVGTRINRESILAILTAIADDEVPPLIVEAIASFLAQGIAEGDRGVGLTPREL